MLSNALSIAILVTASFIMLYKKLPPNLRRYIVKYSLVTDFLAMVITYYMFGGTVTALLAGAMVDVMISVILYIANHPQDFEWLFDALKTIRELLNKAQAYLKELNRNYRAHKTETQAPDAQPTVDAQVVTA